MHKLAGCIDRGLQAVCEGQKQVKEYVEEVRRVEATLDPSKGSVKQRRRRFHALKRRLKKSGDGVRVKMAVVMVAFSAGLFCGEEVDQEIRDNLELERWFRLPKGAPEADPRPQARRGPPGAGRSDADADTRRPQGQG